MFIKSNIIETFNSSVKNNDEFIRREVLMSKIGELFVKDRPDITALLKKRQIVIGAKETDLQIVSKMLDQISRSDDFASDLMKLLLRKDGKDANYIQSPEGKRIFQLGISTLKSLPKHSKISKYIIEAKKQHQFMFAADGTITEPIKKSNFILNAVLISAGIFLAYKIYQSVNSNKKKDKEEVENELSKELNTDQTETFTDNGSGAGE